MANRVARASNTKAREPAGSGSNWRVRRADRRRVGLHPRPPQPSGRRRRWDGWVSVDLAAAAGVSAGRQGLTPAGAVPGGSNGRAPDEPGTPGMSMANDVAHEMSRAGQGAHGATTFQVASAVHGVGEL